MTSRDKNWPGIPAELKGKCIRIPGVLRNILSSSLFSDEEVGRIVRCIIMDTDYFITPRIEAEVLYWRRKIYKDIARNRQIYERFKKVNKGEPYSNKNAGKSHFSNSALGLVNSSVAAVANPDTTFSTCEKTPSLKEKIPPYSPPQKETSPSLEKKDGSLTPDLEDCRLLDGMRQDVFTFFSDTRSKMNREGGLESEQRLDDKSIVQDIGRAPRAVLDAPDARPDVAWIPERFAVFWERYPRRIGKCSAQKAFTKIIKGQKDVEKFMKTTLSSLEWWKGQQSWRKENGKFIPYPATWLNRGCWADIEENDTSSIQNQTEFLKGSIESDEELIRRMRGGCDV